MIFSLVAMTGLEKCCITSAYLQWLCHSGERPVARGPLVFGFFVENHLLANKNPVSMTYGLRVIIIAGNGPYFSHYFHCWKTHYAVSTTYGFRVLCLIHSCEVITHCRVKQGYPLIKLHLWCPRLKKDGHLRCGQGICHLFWWLFLIWK